VIPAALLRAVPHRLGRRRSEQETLASASNQLTPNPVVDGVIRRFLKLERVVAKRFHLPIGTSVLGVYGRA
jgi:hypothetical protein